MYALIKGLCLGRRDRWETPRASFIPAQGNALGSSAQNSISAESAIHPSSYQPPAWGIKNVCLNWAGPTNSELYEAGPWPERASSWSRTSFAATRRVNTPGRHPNPFFIRAIREIRGSPLVPLRAGIWPRMARMARMGQYLLSMLSEIRGSNSCFWV